MGCTSSSPKKKQQLIMKKNDKKTEIKLVFLGDAGVGKSCIAQRYCYNKFNPGYEGGEERFRAMAPLYYRDANAAVLVYDVQDANSFKSLQFWLSELQDKIQGEGLVIGVAGNKCDVDQSLRQVSKDQATQFAKNNNLIFFETSAMTEEGIGPLFQSISEEYAKQKLK